MIRILLVVLLIGSGCSGDQHTGDQHTEDQHTGDQLTGDQLNEHQPAMDEMSGSDHSAHSQVPPPLQPALGELSLYQLDTPWTDHTGTDRALESLAGIPVLAAMTYTSCQVSCPVIIANLKDIESQLDEAGVEARIVLFSFDPDRDTPEHLTTFREEKGLSDRWVLLRAPDDQVREMAALFGVNYRRTPDGEFSHSNIISILDEGGVLVYQQIGLGAGKPDETAQFLIDDNR